MIDFHCHLDLYENPMKVFAEVKKRKTEVLAVTTSPRAYVKTAQYFRESDTVRVALGFHPTNTQIKPEQIFKIEKEKLTKAEEEISEDFGLDRNYVLNS